MDVIALRGNSDVGKSTTINIVYQLMLFNGYTQLPGHFRVLGNPVQKDFIDVLELHGVKIGVVSQGDLSRGIDSLRNHLAYLQSVGCAKAVCACTTNIGTVKAVMSYPIHHFQNKVPSTTSSLERIENNRDAIIIYRLI